MTASTHSQQPKGAALVALVATLLAFSLLAAALVPMMSSSSQQSAVGNLSAKAYLLAESGYRYAASKFVNAGSTDQAQNQALENLDGSYTLEDNAGKFNLLVYSYFYELTQDVNGEIQFNAHVPGNFPGSGDLPDDPNDEIELDRYLKIKIDGETYTLAPGSTETSDDTVRFHVDRALKPHTAGTPVYPVADVDLGENTTISNGDPLIYEDGDARMFPLRNGYIRVNGRTLSYGFNDRDAHQFTDVRDPNDPNMSGFDVSADPEIVLSRYVRLHATGICGAGDLQTQRQVVYYTPVPPTDTGESMKEFSDQFNSADNWSDTSGTATSARQTGGDSALTVVTAPTVGAIKGSLTTFSPSAASQAATSINFAAAHRTTRGYVSYDTQIKVGYEADADPPLGYDPVSPIPAYAGAGLSFRLGGNDDLFNNNSYGISILRGDNGVEDDIPNDLVPLQGERVLVFWRQTGNGSQRTWLAYKRLNEILIDEDNEDRFNNEFEEGTGSYNLWDIDPPSAAEPSRQRSGSTRNWYYGITDVPFLNHTYDWQVGGVSVRNSGTLRSSPFALPADTPKVTLTFWSWYETEPGRLGTHDLKQIEVTTSGSTVLRTYTIDGVNPPATIDGPEDGWYQYLIDDLEDFAGQTIRIQFHFDTVDELNNGYEGWYVDDIQLKYHWAPADLQEATILLRLKEAMVVRFNNGTSAINEGDRVYGGTRNTTGTVLMPPFIQSGTWGGSPAARGVLLLNDTIKVTTNSDEFYAGEQLLVMGTPGQAEVESWNDTYDEKANILQVYLATKYGRGNGTDGIGTLNPMDNHTVPYGRLGLPGTTVTELQWPPTLNSSGNWVMDGSSYTASEDYFQLIQWDEVNPMASGLFELSFRTNSQGLVEHAILQSQHPELKTADYPGIYQQPEVGLHSLGDGAENIYFDDFGIRLIVSEVDVLPTPIQQ